ncbi:hypothetical protein M0805_000513 [Coniferiporia weirii]|nr:hypothetical protein M0805_000513 [Coniferiporia weirii]
MTTSSRPSSPSRRSRALSPTRPDIPRPPSRCESLLRDTLRRADEQERVRSHRSGSRSPGRWAGTKRARPHGNPFMGALRPEDQGDSDCDCDDMLFAYSPNERDNYSHSRRRSIVGNAPRVVRGANYSSPTEAVSYPYGSPSSPSPMPPLMTRTHTAPAVPRPSIQHTRTSEHRGASTRLSPSPRADRRSLPNTVMQSHVHSNVASGESSPKLQRTHTLSPHESVLRAKLEYVLQKAGPSPTDEADGPPRFVGRVRKHQRAFSHGVTVNTSSRRHDEPSSASPSPQSLAASSLSNSASDLARAYSSPSYGGDSVGQGSTPSPPSEPLTPPPTPPFNARTALEMCKRMEGYVSFASVEGLGEPPGMDIDSDDSEENLRLWARWWRKWSFTNGANGAAIHGLAGLTVGRHRSDSASSR